MAISVEYVNPFIDAAKSVLKTVCNDEVNIGKLSLKDSPYYTSDVVVVLGITGQIKGQVVFSMQDDVARGIASKMMMGMEVPELDDMSKSAISELTNMILGNTATNFSNRGVIIDITPPSLLTGKEMKVSTGKEQVICIPLQFMTNGMTFEVNIGLKEE